VKKKKSSVNVDLSVRAQVFCIREGYKVYPVTSNNIKYKIVAEKETSGRNQVKEFTEEYDIRTIHSGLVDTCLKIYNKYKC